MDHVLNKRNHKMPLEGLKTMCFDVSTTRLRTIFGTPYNIQNAHLLDNPVCLFLIRQNPLVLL